MCVDFSHIEKTEENTRHLEAQPYIHFEAYLLCVFKKSFVLVIKSDVTKNVPKSSALRCLCLDLRLEKLKFMADPDGPCETTRHERFDGGTTCPHANVLTVSER